MCVRGVRECVAEVCGKEVGGGGKCVEGGGSLREGEGSGGEGTLLN